MEQGQQEGVRWRDAGADRGVCWQIRCSGGVARAMMPRVGAQNPSTGDPGVCSQRGQSGEGQCAGKTMGLSGDVWSVRPIRHLRGSCAPELEK